LASPVVANNKYLYKAESYVQPLMAYIQPQAKLQQLFAVSIINNAYHA